MNFKNEILIIVYNDYIIIEFTLKSFIISFLTRCIVSFKLILVCSFFVTVLDNFDFNSSCI